jgi:hypothetical protein
MAAGVETHLGRFFLAVSEISGATRATSLILVALMAVDGLRLQSLAWPVLQPVDDGPQQRQRKQDRTGQELLRRSQQQRLPPATG